MVEGYELWHIECIACGRKVTRDGGNEFVGTQARWRCQKCKHLGAELRRVWHVGQKKPGTRPG